VAGAGRVSTLILARAGAQRRVLCDAVILAGEPRPLRNVDGAVTDGSDGVTFIQPIGEHTTQWWAADQARTAAREVLKRAMIAVNA
jgi:hypothetical protein